MSQMTYTVEEAARKLGIGRNSAYEGVRRGQIPSIRVGKRILIPKAALDTMLKDTAIAAPGNCSTAVKA